MNTFKVSYQPFAQPCISPTLEPIMSLKLLTIFTSSALLCLSSSQLKAEESAPLLPSKLVAVSANTSLDEADQELQGLFNHSSKPAIRLTFLVKAQNIVQVMEKSVFTKGSNAWKCGSFPRISQEGEAAAFIIEQKGEFIKDIKDTTVEGTIDIQLGSKLIQKTFNLMSYDKSFQLDNFNFTMLEDKLKVEGNHQLIKELIVELDGQTLRQGGSSWSNNYKTYNYKGIGKGVKITLSYWDGLITKKVLFKKSTLTTK